MSVAAIACHHQNRERRICEFANGSWHVAEQCLSCGARVGNWKRQSGSGAYRRWDHTLASKAAEKLLGKERRRQEEAARPQYEEYLQSPAWRAKRARVLDRAKGICEGCGEWPASQVHHLTYAHLGEELLWELRAVCDACHRRCHPEKETQ